MEKCLGSHNGRRTKAIASANVGWVLRYHAVLRMQGAPCSISSWAVSVMIVERLSSAGVVRAIARSFPEAPALPHA